MTNEKAIVYNENLKEYMRMTDKNSEHKFLAENYEALDMANKALESKPKWVPISKGMSDADLPENYQRVLITVVNYAGNKVVRVAKYIERSKTFKVLENAEWWMVRERGLLAWMTLPEAYKEEVR